MGNLIAPMAHNGPPNCSIAADPNPPINGVRLALFLLEMAINAAVLASSVLFALLLVRIHSFSKTMKVIFWNMLVAADGIAATRLFLLIPQNLSYGNLFGNFGLIKTAQIFHDICINVNTFNQLAITLACMFSKLNTKVSLTKPDHSVYAKFSIFVLWTVQLLWPWFFTALFLYLENRDLFTTIPQFICLEMMNILSWIIFVILYFINKDKYKKMCASNLDQKYQITVQIRNLRTLLFLSAMASARNLVTMSLLMFIVLHLGPSCARIAKLYCDHAYDLTVTIYSLLLIVPLVATHAEFRKQFRRIIFGPATQTTATVSLVTSATVYPRNVFGESLMVPQSTEAYYRQLERSWQQLPDMQYPGTTTVIMSPVENTRRESTQLRRTMELVKWRRRAIRRSHNLVMLDVELPDNFPMSQRPTKSVELRI